AFKRLYHLSKPFFVSEVKWKAISLFVLLLLFSVSMSGVNVLMSYIGRDFMTSLSLREKDEFIKQLYYYLLAFALATPVVVFYRYTEERLGLMWRRWLSHRILHEYLLKRAYFKIHWYEGIDNPDQRITEDIRSFCVQSLSFLLIIFNSMIALFAFMGILMSISYTLVIAVLLYSLGGSLVAYFLGKPLIGLNFSQLKKEADYRYKLINVRENSEPIAFYRAERKEGTRIRQRLKDALNNLLHIINWNRNLNFFTTGYNYLVTILPTIIVAPLYFDGKIQFGEVTQAGFAFAQVLGALSIIVSNFSSISAYGAVVTRLGAFREALDVVHKSEVLLPGPVIQVKDGEDFVFENVNIYTPRRDQKIVNDLSFELKGKSLFITGASGCGKSSIFRVLAGLWVSGTGKIVRPPMSKIMFLPQRPYMVLGSFRSQLLYGTHEHGISEKSLMDIIRKIQLEELLHRVGGFDSVRDWPNILSTGEQQRIAFGRLLLVRPEYALLDEATTALDKPSERLLYGYMKAFVKNFITVGYRNSLSDQHAYRLELTIGGKWQLIRKEDTPQSVE
ncbi:MAG: ABC transporter ATP-binding protein/permease, partial [SAR324 cluster bacterium]|nr:ABC transporter ATP-binding protein/permease [SAR324 cluster bacterium]